MAATHFRTCTLCEAMCGIAIEHEAGRVLSIRGDREDPFSRGHVCPKAVALQDVHEDPDRVRRPLRRDGDAWRTIGWDEALHEAAERIAAIQEAHGRSAVALYQGNPTVHNYGAVLYGQVFARALRSRNLYSATSVDQLPSMLAALSMFGHQLLMPIPDVDRTDFMLILGANPVASNGSLMTAPGIERRLRALRGRGGRLVVVDPRRTETATIADRHLGIRPGTDVFLLSSLLQTIVADGLARPGRLAAFTDGLETIARAVAPFTPERTEPITGLAAADVRQLARDFAAAGRAVAYGRVGVSTQEHGALCCWLVNVLNVVTGNLDRAGGAMFTRPAVDLVGLATRIGQRGHFDRRRSRVRGLPEFGGELPVAALAEEIETPGEGRIRALVTAAGNPVLSAPNGRRLDRALASLDFMVAIDVYRNETTRHAHLILPPTFALEHDHYDVVFHMLAVRNTAKYSPALFDAGPDARHDWQILLELARRLARAKGEAGFRVRLVHALLGRLGPRGAVDVLLRLGPYGLFRGGLSIRALERAAHGVDLGPLTPLLPGRLATANRRIDLAPARMIEALERLAVPAADGLVLIGRRDLRSNNSWMHNSDRLTKGRERCTLLMHPQDAAERGLADGACVRVRSRVGAIDVPLALDDAMTRGVVSLPHGWGHDRPGTRITLASRRPGASVNDLNDDARVDPLCGNAAFSGLPVEVTAATTTALDS